MLRVTPRTVHQLAESGELPGGVRIGRLWRFDREKLEAHLNRTLPDPEDDTEAKS